MTGTAPIGLCSQLPNALALRRGRAALVVHQRPVEPGEKVKGSRGPQGRKGRKGRRKRGAREMVIIAFRLGNSLRSWACLVARTVQDDALHSAHQDGDVEVDRQREWASRRLQVGERLRDVDFGEALDSFELHDEDTFDEQVYSARADLLSLVVDAKPRLPFEGYAPESRFHRERVLVNRLRLSRSEMSVHLDRRLDQAPSHDVHVRWCLREPRLVLRRIIPLTSDPLRP